jgi:hypothetical protein
MNKAIKIWVKFTGKHRETHRYICEDAREAVAIKAGADEGLPMEELPDLAEACKAACDEYGVTAPIEYIARIMAAEVKSSKAGISLFDPHDPKDVVSYVKSTLK